MNLGGDPVDALWAIAQHAEGWGKIEAVKQLAPLVGERPDVKRWLVTDGCANGVMDEYLGHVCATAGELASALAGDVDEALVDGASTIVSALCGAEPGEDMHDYDDAPFVVERVLDLLQDRCTMDRLDAVIDLKFWLEEDHPPDSDGLPPEIAEPRVRRAAVSWTDERRRRLIGQCVAIPEQPTWPRVVHAALSGGDPGEQGRAWRIAQEIGVDLWEAGYEKLAREPLDLFLFFHLIADEERSRRRRVLAWAEERLPLDELATGPALVSDPIGPEYFAHTALTRIVQVMHESDLYRERPLEAGLRAPVISTRRLALAALRARPRAEWGSAVEQAVRALSAGDPDHRARGQAQKLLA